MLLLYMTGRSLLNVNFVTKLFLKRRMNKHIGSIHDAKKSFVCGFCQKYCSQKSTLSLDITSVHDGKKPFECEFCVKSFSKKSSLNTHIGCIHDSKKSIVCGFCQKSFSQKKSRMCLHVTSINKNFGM